MLAQPGERATHRGLAHRHPLAGVGEVALLQQGVEGQREVGVDLRIAPSRTSLPPAARDSSLADMALGGTDLNLLLPLKVLLEEGNVTRAGQRLS